MISSDYKCQVEKKMKNSAIISTFAIFELAALKNIIMLKNSYMDILKSNS